MTVFLFNRIMKKIYTANNKVCVTNVLQYGNKKTSDSNQDSRLALILFYSLLLRHSSTSSPQVLSTSPGLTDCLQLISPLRYEKFQCIGTSEPGILPEKSGSDALSNFGGNQIFNKNSALLSFYKFLPF